jgi:deazaflavin-dependent oxidoreductase (nitroreductase family)
MPESAREATGGSAEDSAPAARPPRKAGWPERRFNPSRAQRVGNSVVAALADWGLIPHTFVMTTRGRKTGQVHTTPVTLVEEDGRKWLVAPYGPVAWVLNARAAGLVTLRRRRDLGMYSVRELSPKEAGPVLKKYLAIASATRPYFIATRTSPVEEFVAEAGKHPVFALTRVSGSGG